MRGVWTVLIVVFALTWTINGASSQRRSGAPKARAVKNPVAATPASVTAGRQVYGRNCRHCHGLRGLGDGPLAPTSPPPANLTDDKWDHGSTDGEIFAVVWNGAPAPDSEMKGMKGTLTEKDVWNVINFLRTIGPKSAPKAAAR